MSIMERKTLLLVEDELPLAANEKLQLEQEGYEIVHAASGEAAIGMVDQSGDRFDLVLMDIELGKGMDGAEAAKAILANRDVPIVFLTDHEEPGLIERTGRIASYGYAAKNAGIAILSVSIQNALRRREGERQLIESRNQAKAIFDTMTEGVALNELLYDASGEPVDYRILAVNNSFHSTADYVGDVVVGNVATKLFGMSSDVIRSFWKERMKRKDSSITEMYSSIRGRSFLIATSPLMDNRFLTTFFDITDRKKVEEELQLFHYRFQQVMNTGSIGWWDMNCQTGAVSSHENKARMLGYEPERFSHYSDFTKLLHPDDYEPIMAAMKAHLEGKATRYDVEYRIRAADGEYRWFHDLGGISVYDEAGKPKMVTGIVIEISERKKIQEELRQSRESYRKLFEDHSAVKLIVDPETTAILDANHAAARFYGWTRDELKRMKIDQLNTLPLEEIKKAAREALEGNRVQFEFRHRRADGSIRDVETFSSRIEMEGKSVLHSIVHDVTERKLAEGRVQSLLREKDLILKEVHHRIKNNMTIMATILRWQSEVKENPEAAVILNDAAGRMESMMVLYDKLYRSENMGEVALMDYIASIIDEIIRIFPRQPAVKIETDIGDIRLKTEILSPLGIIINELVTNSMKYAFKNRTEGKITIGISKTGNHVSIVYGDDGPGIPESVSFRNTTGFGLQLVGILVLQIGGSVDIERSGGTRFIIGFDV
jgi:PAS domain S-box-containing protein